jgi:hypothetical protein
MSKRRSPPPTPKAAARATAPRAPRPTAPVVSLSDARLERRLADYRQRLDRVLQANKRAVGQLYVSGGLFTRAGTRAGRDLLLAHEHLLRVLGLLDRLAHEGDVPAPRRPAEVDAVLAELDTLLARTDELTQHTGRLLDELKRR